jgi:dihydroxyacetone kinase
MERLVNSKRLALKNETSLPLVVLLNNLGSTTQLEMGILQREILNWLRKSGII